MDELQDELLKDLRIELADDLHSDSDVAILSLKIKNAIREVKKLRNYRGTRKIFCCRHSFCNRDLRRFYEVFGV